MADITIVKIDENKSKPSASQPHYVAVLSGKPDQTWKNNLVSPIQQNKNPQIINVRVELNPGNELTFDTKPDVDLKQMVTTIQAWLKQLDSAEDQFKDKIREVNKKLFEPAA
ncbi:MAG TPA: hypothetical protein VE842_08060 [Pyrinomonadaceae bacterium]|jgi:hypothetical protein|nr:hypothetical protein [Pyrinomonadaceae bacterium]